MKSVYKYLSVSTVVLGVIAFFVLMSCTETASDPAPIIITPAIITPAATTPAKAKLWEILGWNWAGDEGGNV